MPGPKNIVNEMERAIRAKCGIPEFAEATEMERFVGITTEKGTPHPKFPNIPTIRRLIDGRRPESGEIERRVWERIYAPLIKARQDYVIRAICDGEKRLWPLISATCMDCNSGERLYVMLPILEALDQSGDSELFWRTMREIWSACDATFDAQQALLNLLRSQYHAAPARRHDGKRPITVYRGGKRGRTNGISWSRSRAVAERFAGGLRGDIGGERVIATASAPRSAVFMYSNRRKEREVLLDPAELLDLTIAPVRRSRACSDPHSSAI